MHQTAGGDLRIAAGPRPPFGCIVPARDAPLGPCRACGKAVRTSAGLYTADAQLMCPICFTKAEVSGAPRRAAFEASRAVLIGLVAAAAPLVCRAAAVVEAGAAPCAWLALAAGAIAVACGGSTIAAARDRASGGWFALGALLVALGAYHLSRGIG
jgi:hypothetical protein